jgi:arylsulfatase
MLKIKEKHEMKKPNILMIMADQFRFDWLSCAGAEFIRTPHIDSIADQGVRFTNAVCNSPLCAPSRASFTAGLYPHRLGVLTNHENYPIDQPTIYQELRKSGYRVGVVGKTDLHKPEHFYGENGDRPLMYHLGFTDPHDTEGKMNAAMFKSAVAGVEAGVSDIEQETLVGPYQKYLKSRGVLGKFVGDYQQRFGVPVWYAKESALSSEDFHDSYIGRKSCEFLENVSTESPWHLFVSFVGPHDPWDAPRDYLQRFEKTQFPAPIVDPMLDKPNWVKAKQKKHSHGMSGNDFDQVRQNYVGMIGLIDDWVGKILATLDRKGLRENTVIIFCADHGEMMGDHGLFQKSVMYEGAIKVPLIISHPELKTKVQNDSLVELVDLYPTMLDFAAISYDHDRLDGKSLLPLIAGKSTWNKEYVISELRNTRMVSDGRYKLIENCNDLDELYDLSNDSDELHNLINAEPAVVERLRTNMRKIRK